jgi:cytochrome P450
MQEANIPDRSGCPFLTEDGRLQPDATFADLAVRANPWPFYDALRRDDPVHYDAELDMYLVARFQDLQQVLSDPITFSVKHGYAEQSSKGFQDEFREIVDREGGGFIADSVGIMNDPPEHTRIRRLLEKAFTAHRVQTLEPEIREIAVELIERIADNGSADGVNDLAAPLTIRFICKQLGFNDIDPNKISEWTAAAVAQIGRMQSREQMLAHARDYCELQNYVIAAIRKRQETRTEDMLSDIVYARLDDEARPTLELAEMISLGRTLLVGGNDTTATGITNLLILLATRPGLAEQLRASRDDDRQMNRFVEELLRLEPPVHGLSRMTTREVDLGGKRLPKGAHLLLLYASGNSDPEAFGCPRDFDVSRSNIGRHVTFGSGVHRCVGLALARMEIKVAAQEISRRLDDIRLAAPLEELKYFSSVAARHPTSLPLTFARRTVG